MLTWFTKWIKHIGNKYVRMTTVSCGQNFSQSMQVRVRKGSDTVAKEEKNLSGVML